ncbi:MAG: carboxypeptidase regulatory-like domain-containing protein, partial [Desulfobacterales bacterium]|nr:carboxypeptidase regulatory-like domain-containing protein [Desulfobacterales bacterium]
GRFKFDGVHAGSYFFEIRTGIDPYDTQRARNEPLVVKAGDVIRDLEVIKDLDVIVEPAKERGKISGRVLDARSGKPIKAFSAKVTRVDSSGEGTPAIGRTTIDKSQEGAFLIEDISTGTATLQILAPGYAREKVRVKVVSGQTTDMTFNLEQGGKLQVYVTLNGKGQMAWVVSARPAGEGPDAEISTQMGKDGRYELTGLKEAEYLVRAPVPLSTGVRGRATVQINNRARVKIEAGKETRLDFELRDNAGIRGAFTGPDKDLSWRILIFDDSAAVRDDSVSEVRQAHALVWKLEQGKHYEIRCLPAGTYRVVGRCCKKEKGWTAVMEKSKTVTVGAGQVAEVDFVFP